MRTCVLACLPLLLLLGILLRRVLEFTDRPVIFPHEGPTAAVKFITDEELFALFPGRPMALIGKPGHQELVFLDKPATIDDQP